MFSVLPPVPVVSQLMSLYLGPSISRTSPSLPSLGGIEGVCPSLKSNVEVRVKGEGHYVAALFRGQIHPFTHSFTYLLPPTMCLAYSVQRQREKANSFPAQKGKVGPREDERFSLGPVASGYGGTPLLYKKVKGRGEHYWREGDKRLVVSQPVPLGGAGQGCGP